MLGIIGGSGASVEQFVRNAVSATVKTEYGQASSSPMVGEASENSTRKVCFLSRHGSTHSLPPHRINYRANIQSMVNEGVTAIISLNTVGACTTAYPVGALVVPDQIIDYSYGRDHSFHDQLDNFEQHIDFTYPFDATLTEKLALSADTLGIELHLGGTYGCTQGPRLETAAEIQRLVRDGCDLVGMTAMPEAALARERGVAYVSLCLVVNPAAGIGEGAVNIESIAEVLEQSGKKIEQLVNTCVVAIDC